MSCRWLVDKYGLLVEGLDIPKTISSPLKAAVGLDSLTNQSDMGHDAWKHACSEFNLPGGVA